jgi:hypothetical protein
LLGGGRGRSISSSSSSSSLAAAAEKESYLRGRQLVYGVVILIKERIEGTNLLRGCQELDQVARSMCVSLRMVEVVGWRSKLVGKRYPKELFTRIPHTRIRTKLNLEDEASSCDFLRDHAYTEYYRYSI